LGGLVSEGSSLQMRTISRIALVAVMACALAVGGSTLAAAKGHGGHKHVHAKLADVIKDVKDSKKDSADASQDKAAAQNDLTTPDSPAEAQREQADAQSEQLDNQSESQDSSQEDDSASQTAACQGLPTDNVQYDEQTGTCTSESSQDQGDGQNDQGDGSATGGQDSSTTTGDHQND
jgi:Skp family chaperone for outer membrane proteins